VRYFDEPDERRERAGEPDRDDLDVLCPRHPAAAGAFGHVEPRLPEDQAALLDDPAVTGDTGGGLAFVAAAPQPPQ